MRMLIRNLQGYQVRGSCGGTNLLRKIIVGKTREFRYELLQVTILGNGGELKILHIYFIRIAG